MFFVIRNILRGFVLAGVIAIAIEFLSGAGRAPRTYGNLKEVLRLCVVIERADMSGEVGPTLVKLYNKYPKEFEQVLIHELSQLDAMLLLERLNTELRLQKEGNG